jgi:hypothetical protein
MRPEADRWLRRFAQSVEPTVSQIERAKRSQNFLRQQLDSGGIGARIVDDYLSGSYRRKTAIGPLKDVDIIFLIDPRGWTGAFLGLADRPKPSDVLRSFATALRYRYPNTSAFTQRRSIRLELQHLMVDCVPAIPISGSDFIWVGDRTEDSWTKSSPKRHHDAVTEANGRNDGLVVPLVKVAKYWNRELPATARLRSFAVETMVVTLFQYERMSCLSEGLLMFFDFVAHVGQGNGAAFEWKSDYGIKMDWWNGLVVPDSADTGANVAAGVDQARMRAFAKHAVTCRDRLLKVEAARSIQALEQHLLTALRVAG